MAPEFGTAQLVALAAALGWASGLRLYAVLALTGIAGATGWVSLPPGLSLLQHPLCIGLSVLMVCLEFAADKIPGVDTLWDVLHTLIRIPAGAALAASVFGLDQTATAGVAALFGGVLAATSHAAKLTARAAVNTSPEPFSNIALSLLEDGLVPFILWLAVSHPAVFYPVLGVGVLAMLAVVWTMSRFLRALWRRLLRAGAAVSEPGGDATASARG